MSEQDGPPTRAAAYLRVSTRKQAEDGWSLGEQQRRFYVYCERRGWEPVEVYSDAISGRTDRRPELQRMRGEVDRFDVLVIARVDRFGRNFRDSAVLKGELDDARKRLVAMDMDVDFSTPGGLTVWAALTAVAEGESRNIGDRVSAVSRPHAESGKVWGGRHVHYGYRRREGGGIEPYEPEGVVVVQVFELADGGMSARAIATVLEADGIRQRNGNRWDPASIRRMLAMPEYYGAVTHKGEVVCERGEHEPLISREVWDRVAQQRASRRLAPGGGRGRLPKAPALFVRGALRCGHCGSAMSPRTYSHSWAYLCLGRSKSLVGSGQECPQKPVPGAMIDAAAVAYFQNVGVDLDATREHVAQQIARAVADERTLREQADRQEQLARERLTRVRRAFQDGHLEAADWAEQRAELTEELAAATAEVERRREQERALIEQTTLRDAEEEVLREFARLRAVASGEVQSASTVDALRAAFLRLFSGFTLHNTSLDPQNVPLTGVADLTLPGWGGLVLEPHVRPEAVERWSDDGQFFELHRTPLYSAADNGANGLKLLSA